MGAYYRGLGDAENFNSCYYVEGGVADPTDKGRGLEIVNNTETIAGAPDTDNDKKFAVMLKGCQYRCGQKLMGKRFEGTDYISSSNGLRSADLCRQDCLSNADCVGFHWRETQYSDNCYFYKSGSKIIRREAAGNDDFAMILKHENGDCTFVSTTTSTTSTATTTTLSNKSAKDYMCGERFPAKKIIGGKATVSRRRGHEYRVE